MARPRGKRAALRFSVVLDQKSCSEVSALANQKDTTVAWIVRRAVGEFIDGEPERTEPELPLRRVVSRAAAGPNLLSEKVQ